MFEYLLQKIKSSQTIDQLKGHVDAFNLQDFFTNDHYSKISKDIESFKKTYTNEEFPPQGTEPSIITFDTIKSSDSFYNELWKFINLKDFKKALLEKFNYTSNLDILLDNSKINITFHTEYPHQIDKAHSDQKNSLSTITLQIYLPADDGLKEYGTQFVDKNVCLYKKEFLPNSGYLMSSNNNSWHKPTLGVERNSLLIRLTVDLEYEKTKTVYNYNSKNKTCYAVWNKDMQVYPKQTDWMMTMTLQNLCSLGFENIAVTSKPFKKDLRFLRNIKKQGFEKVLIVFGGYVWKNNSIVDYINNIELTTAVAGWSNNGKELARQCLLVNLNKIDQLDESFADNKFFEECINDYTDIGIQVRSNRYYYHPETDEQDSVTGWITNRYSIENLDLSDKVDYFSQYLDNHTTLQSLTKSMLKQ